VLITGAGAPPGMTAIRSLRDSPLDLSLIAADSAPYAAGLFEDGLDASLVLPSAARSPALYRDAITQVCERYKVDLVIPGSEAEAEALAPVAGDFREHGIEIPVPAPAVLRLGTDKGALAERVRQHGCNAPLTLAVDTEHSLDEWPDMFPCVLKPRASRGARGVSYPADRAALHRDWRQTSAAHGPCLVQAFIPGGVERIYTVGTIHCDGRLMLATVHRKLATNPPGGGAALAGEALTDDTVRAAALDILNVTGPWHGFAAVEMKLSENDGKPWLLEINPRLWGFSQLMTLAGVNVPELLVRALSGEFGDGPVPAELTAYKPVRAVRSWVDRIIPDGFAPEVIAP